MTSARSTPRYAVIGNPVSHSRSPDIHALFARQTGTVLAYDKLEAPLDAFALTVNRFFEDGGKGLNVTVPFKLQAHALAQPHLSERARRAGAVNTLWREDGQLHACNTDGVGLAGDLVRLRGSLGGARLLLVGAGGAARGVLQSLLDEDCEHILVVNRTASRAHDLVHGWRDAPLASRLAAGGLPDAGGRWDVVVNATASSIGDAVPDLPTGLYQADGLAYDMMYGAAPTAFMRQAVGDGAAQAADGLGMLVGQAAESFRIWHGVRPDVAPVLTVLRGAIEGRS